MDLGGSEFRVEDANELRMPEERLGGFFSAGGIFWLCDACEDDGMGDNGRGNYVKANRMEVASNECMYVC